MIDWKKCPEAAQVTVNYLDANGDTINFDVFAPPKQTKTVADAVEWAKGEWRYDECDAIAYNAADDIFGYYNLTDIKLSEKWHLVCTRAEFEAYVKEQEGEKWTHETAECEYCRILIGKPDQFGNVVILKEEWGYSDYPLSSLKPIKPTIDESQAWVKMQSLIPKHGVTAAYQMTIQQYDII